MSKLITKILTLFYQVFIYGTAILSQLHQFWDTIQNKLAYKNHFTTRIEGIRIRLPELQDDDKKAKKLRLEGLLED